MVWMKSILLICVLSCGNRVVNRVKIPEIDKVTVDANFYLPFAIPFVPTDASVTRFVPACASLISPVCDAIDLPQVSPLIVTSIAIDMINFWNRPFPCHHKKYDVMNAVGSAVEFHLSICFSTAYSVLASSHHSGLYMLTIHKPSKMPYLRIVGQYRAQIINCKICF
jgi:hypothetical protein